MTDLNRRQLLVGASAALALAACGRTKGSTTDTDPSGAGFETVVEPYGDHRLQVGEWSVPSGTSAMPTVMLVHGGFWRAQYGRSLEDAVAANLAGLGYLVWNIDYRPSTTPWPTTLTDVAAAYDHLSASKFAGRIDRSRLAVVGHSAGGQLILWLAGRHLLPAGAPGADPTTSPPSLAVSQAGVDALRVAEREDLGAGAVVALCDGTPAEVPEHYSVSDPIGLLPTGVKTVLIHGLEDDIVPISQSELYEAAATRAGENCTLDKVPGGHFVHLDPSSVAVERLRQSLHAM